MVEGMYQFSLSQCIYCHILTLFSPTGTLSRISNLGPSGQRLPSMLGNLCQHWDVLLSCSRYLRSRLRRSCSKNDWTMCKFTPMACPRGQALWLFWGCTETCWPRDGGEGLQGGKKFTQSLKELNLSLFSVTSTEKICIFHSFEQHAKDTHVNQGNKRLILRKAKLFQFACPIPAGLSQYFIVIASQYNPIQYAQVSTPI
jgi:hypothetical protein